jgi:hypothetical protein
MSPVSERWILNLASRQPVELWHGEARRLRATLNAISGCVEREYATPLIWRSETLSAEQWSDLDEIAAKMVREQLRDDNDTIMHGGGASSVVQGYRDDLPKPMTNALWTAGSDEWPFVCNIDFYAATPDSGEGKPLSEHPATWLVELLCTAAVAAHASHAQIHARTLLRLLMRAREDNDVGVLTLAPHGIDTTALPHSITAHPCPSGFPDGMVLMPDLDRVARDPASLVADLLAVDDAIKRRATEPGRTRKP